MYLPQAICLYGGAFWKKNTYSKLISTQPHAYTHNTILTSAVVYFWHIWNIRLKLSSGLLNPSDSPNPGFHVLKKFKRTLHLDEISISFTCDIAITHETGVCSYLRQSSSHRSHMFPSAIVFIACKSFFSEFETIYVLPLLVKPMLLNNSQPQCSVVHLTFHEG